MHFSAEASGLDVFDGRPWPQVSRWDVPTTYRGQGKTRRVGGASLSPEDGARMCPHCHSQELQEACSARPETIPAGVLMEPRAWEGGP